MTALKPGDAAPNIALTLLDGQPASLAEAWRGGQNALLVFLRHLGWLPCREHVAQLRQHAAELERLKARVVVISFGSAIGARAWLEETGTPFTLLLDLQRAAYRAYGLDYSLLRSWGLKTLWTYARLLLAGRRWRGIQGDSGQLGGDFIVDTNGIIRLAYRGHDPTDRPPVSQLLSALRRLSPENLG